MPEPRPVAVSTQHSLSPENVLSLLPLFRRGLSEAHSGEDREGHMPREAARPHELSPARAETNVALISTLVLKGCCLRRDGDGTDKTSSSGQNRIPHVKEPQS